jgi:hypothetical protein
VIAPFVTVNEFISTVGPDTARESGVGRLKTDGADSMMTALAFTVALSTKPSISPVTVPGVFPGKTGPVKEKSKLSA